MDGSRVSFICSVVATIVAIAPLSPARADWPNFRGPRHDGISDETGFKTTWDSAIPLVWDREVGSAFSSFACVGDRVYTCGTTDDQQVMYCLDADSGQIVWSKPFERQYRDPQGGDGTRATPTVEGDRVYIQGGHGTVVCFNADNGQIAWRREFQYPPQWGYSGSVLIEGDLAITTGGSSQGALAAFDKQTGDPKWKCGDDPAGYASPYPFSFNGKHYVAGFTGDSLIVADAHDGNLVLRIPWETDWKVNAATPIFHDGHLFLTSGYSTGSALFKLRADGNKLAADEIWRSKVLMNKFQTPVLYEGKLYSSDQKALVCVDFMTGKEMWREHHVQHGTVFVADGHLMLLTQDGTLQIAKADPTGFQPLTTAQILSGRCWTVPVLYHGRLYARNLERVACFNLKP